MTWLRAATLAFLALLLGLFPLVLPADGAVVHGGSGMSSSAGLAGQWVVSVNESCTPTPDNAPICRRILGPFTSLQNPAVFVSDAAGHVTFQDTFVVSEQAAGAGPLCSPDIFARPFSGVCRISEYGSASIRPGATGLPDFWVTDETTTFYGTSPLSGVHDVLGVQAFPLDTLIPAVPGYYDTPAYLALLHLPVLPGVSAQVVVSQIQPADPVSPRVTPTPRINPCARMTCCHQARLCPL